MSANEQIAWLREATCAPLVTAVVLVAAGWTLLRPSLSPPTVAAVGDPPAGHGSNG